MTNTSSWFPKIFASRFTPVWLIPLASLAFWWFRIMQTPTMESIGVGNMDLFISYIPRTNFVFESLRSGHLPLWNPYQLCGQPMLAVPASGIFYPLNWIYLVLDVPHGVEALFILHSILGGWSMFGLARHIPVGVLAAFCAAGSFIWSGYVMMNLNQPVIHVALMWMPMIAWQALRVADGRRDAAVALALSVAASWLVGATEVLAHTFVAAGFLAGARLWQRAWPAKSIPWQTIGVALVAVAMGTALAALQIIPSVEMVNLSARAPGALSPDEVFGKAVSLSVFLEGMIAHETYSPSRIGFLPLLLLPLAIASRRHRSVAIGAALALLLAAVMTKGGVLASAYSEIPLIGTLFRRTTKFADIYALTFSILAAIGVEELLAKAKQSVLLWRDSKVRAGLAVGGAFLVWALVSSRSLEVLVIASILMAVLFGLAMVPARLGHLRVAGVGALVALQLATLFFAFSNPVFRPVQNVERFDAFHDILERARPGGGQERLYIAPEFFSIPSLTARQGSLLHIPVSLDYEPLSSQRYAEFFSTFAKTAFLPFMGVYSLDESADWQSYQLTGTRYFLVPVRSAAAVQGLTSPPMKLIQQSRNVIPGKDERTTVRLYESTDFLPRAYLVQRARVIEEPVEVLRALQNKRFDPSREAIVEAPLSGGSLNVGFSGSAEIISYEAERVVIITRTAIRNLLVLSDLYYPGWVAFVDDEPAVIERTNYLFRGVSVPRGQHTVRFEFRPTSFRMGLAISAAAAALLALISMHRLIRNRS